MKNKYQKLSQKERDNVSNLDTSKMTDMSSFFEGEKEFNEPLNLDTSNVENMDNMFAGAESFNQDTSAWDVSKVK
jgi:hypothetical protein